MINFVTLDIWKIDCPTKIKLEEWKYLCNKSTEELENNSKYSYPIESFCINILFLVP